MSGGMQPPAQPQQYSSLVVLGGSLLLSTAVALTTAWGVSRYMRAQMEEAQRQERAERRARRSTQLGPWAYVQGTQPNGSQAADAQQQAQPQAPRGKGSEATGARSPSHASWTLQAHKSMAQQTVQPHRLTYPLLPSSRTLHRLIPQHSTASALAATVAEVVE
ncbi:hypothetical protein V8C86DRAFT_382648 [Haematococcus lacustris]